MKVESGSCVTGEDMWSCLGAIDIDRRNLLVFWESSWHSAHDYHELRAHGNRGWLVHTRGEDQLLIAWEPTMERKSIQPSLCDLFYEPAIEVRKNRPGLLGYVAAKALHDCPNTGNRHLAFLAYWKVAPMTRGLFFHLQEAFSSHRGYIVHTEKDKVWIQWEPTWVFYRDLDKKKKEQLLPVCHDPEALLRRFHKVVIHYSTRLAVGKRIM